MRKFSWLTGAVALGAIVLGANVAQAAIVLDLDNLGPSTVNVGDTIVARISMSTSNANGIAGVNARISTTLDSIGSANFDATPFRAALQPEDGTDSGGVNEAASTNFSATLLAGGSTYTLAPYSAVQFGLVGGYLQPTGPSVPPTNNNRPITGFAGQGTGGRGAPAFFSASNAIQTFFAEVIFRATEEGTVHFGIAGSGSPTEYTALTGTTTQAATIAAASGAGFSVNIVPEPSTLGLVMAGGAAALLRRRRRTD